MYHIDFVTPTMDIKRFFTKAQARDAAPVKGTSEYVSSRTIGDALANPDIHVDDEEIHELSASASCKTKFERVKEAVLALSVEKKDWEVARKEWVAAGGMHVTDIGAGKKYAHRISPEYYFAHFSDKFPLPPLVQRCPCRTPIKHNCYIYNIINGNDLTLGNCCIQTYVPECARKSCELCGDKHKSMDTNFCNACKGHTCSARIVAILNWAKKNPRFDTKFVESVKAHFIRKRNITPNQSFALYNIIGKFGITTDQPTRG
jgi:hypothetical protein